MNSFLRICLAIFGFIALGHPCLRGATVDVAVFYTQKVMQSHSDEDGVIALVQFCIEKANMTFDRSEADVRLRLVAVEYTSYVEDETDFGVDLDRIGKRDGFADEILDIREAVGADLVCLFRMESSENDAGIAYILRNEQGTPSTGFSVVNAREASSSNVFTHEVGHNLGAAHDRENAESEGLYSYSYGYRFTSSTGAQLRTVMAYSPGWRIDHFSNPEVLIEGIQTGVKAGDEGEAENARTVQNASSIVAGYYPSKPIGIKVFLASEFYGEAKEDEEQAEVVLEATPIFSAGEEITWHWTWAGGEAFGQNVSAEFPVGETPVQLTVTDALGGRGEYDTVVVVAMESPVASIAQGEGHELVLLENGALLVRGANDRGQLGFPGIESLDRYKLLRRSVSSIAAYGETSVYIMEDGSVWGMGAQFTGIEKIAASSAKKAVVGANHVLVQMMDGSLWGIGSNYRGAIGLENETEMVDELALVVSEGVVDMAAGDYHSLFVLEDGSLWGMGENLYVGLQRPYNQVIRVPTRVMENGFKRVSSYRDYSIAVGLDGSVWSTGLNFHGQLGTGDRKSRFVFTKVIDSGIIDVYCAPSYGLLLDKDGSIWVLGNIRDREHDALVGLENLGLSRIDSILGTRNKISMVRNDGSLWEIPFEYDRHASTSYFLPEDALPAFVLGRIDPEFNAPPTAVAGPDIFVGDDNFDGWASVILDAGASSDDWAVIDWEWSWEGNLLSGKQTIAEFPLGSTIVTLKVTDHEGATSEDVIRVTVEAYEVSRIIQIEAGWGGLNLYRHANGLVSANGVNHHGVISPENIGESFYRPRIIWDGVPAVDIAIGREFCLILCEDGSLWGKGARLHGNLGNNAGEPSDTHCVQVLASGVVEFAAGSHHSLCIKEDGSVWGFGSNSRGQLGLGNTAGGSVPRLLISGGAKAVAAAYDNSFVIMDDGNVMGFGSNNAGQLGPSGLDFSTLKKLPFENVSKIASGISYTVALLEDGSAWRYGHSELRRLGSYYGNQWQGTFRKNVKDVYVGNEQTLVVMNDGSAWGLGWNFNAVLGAGPGNDYSQPLIVHQSGVVAAAGGYGNSMYIREDGTIWGTGHDWDGVAQEPNEFSRLLSGEVISPFPIFENQKPNASFRLDPLQFKLSTWESVGLTLDGTNSADDWQIVSWEWNWDDVILHGQSVTGSFSAGTHSITLKVSDLYGEVSEMTKTIEVINADVFEDWVNYHFTLAEVEAMGEDIRLLDLDGDELSNEEEWKFGMDPKSHRSRFWIQSRFENENQLVLSVPQIRNHANTVISLLKSINGDSWEVVEGPVDYLESTIEFTGLSFQTLYKVKLELQ